jgi:hypothetical protein
MSEAPSDSKPKAVYEPGTLDKIRKNLGDIDNDEATRMAHLLGGEIFTEKSTPIDYASLPRAKNRTYVHKKKASGISTAELSKALGERQQNTVSAAAGTGSITENGRLPSIAPRDRTEIDKLMMSERYGIKPNYGIFNFIRHIQKGGTERVIPEFCEITLHTHIRHLENFITQVQTLLQAAPGTYKAKIQQNEELKFQFLNKVASWSTKSVNLKYLDLQRRKDILTVPDLIPYVKKMYTMLICVFFIGETKVPELIKDIYSDLLKYPDADRKKLTIISKGIIEDWLYLYGQVIRGLYPLLMRMVGGHFEAFPDFFIHRINDILKYLELTKYSLLLPQNGSQKKNAGSSGTAAGEEQKTKNRLYKKPVHGIRNEVVNNGLKLLENLFPESGFLSIESMPDMYPYFQPIFEFEDGYNLLSPENPLQITVTLLRILEDLFQGCRNIKFDFDTDEKGKSTDSLSKSLDEWTVYREVLFEKNYSEYLKDMGNQLYSQSDFAQTQYGKKIVSTLLWQTKYNFLPHFKFEQLLLERPADDSPYRPLCLRTEFIRENFRKIAVNISAAEKTKSAVSGISNPWARYKFDIPNIVSKRLDVLLGARRPDATTAATNANLLKYTLCIVAVLDWWINNPESPAYSADPRNIYRISDKDGAPLFSVPVRNDQNKLFAASVKAAIKPAKH